MQRKPARKEEDESEWAGKNYTNVKNYVLKWKGKAEWAQNK